MKRLICFLMVGMLFSCKDNPVKPDPPKPKVSVEILQPEDGAWYLQVVSQRPAEVPCEAKTENIGADKVIWKVNGEVANCDNGELRYDFSNGDSVVSAEVNDGESSDIDNVTITIDERLPPVEIEILQPESHTTFFHDEVIPCEVKVEHADPNNVVWKVNGEVANCEDGELQYDFYPGEYEISARAENEQGGGTYTIIIFIEERLAPKVNLGAKLPRLDFDISYGEIRIADGEAVELHWDIVEGHPEECFASGDWSGDKDLSGYLITEGLPGPQRLVFTITCRNSLGEDSDQIEVDVAAYGQMYAQSDRTDEKSQEQVKVIYAIPKDFQARDLDLLPRGEGGILDDVERFQKWFQDEAGGSRFRMDTYDNGKLDITRIYLNETVNDLEWATHGGNMYSIIEANLESKGFDMDNKKYLVYYEGTRVTARGFGGRHLAIVFLRQGHHYNPPADLATRPTAAHELGHTMNVVSANAPNVGNGAHVTEPCPESLGIDTIKDLMCSGTTTYPEHGPGIPVLDYGRDDYYNGPNDAGSLPEDVTNMAESPWIIHP